MLGNIFSKIVDLKNFMGVHIIWKLYDKVKPYPVQKICLPKNGAKAEYIILCHMDNIWSELWYFISGHKFTGLRPNTKKIVAS